MSVQTVNASGKGDEVVKLLKVDCKYGGCGGRVQVPSCIRNAPSS